MKNGKFYEVLPDGRFQFWIDHHLINSHNQCERLFMYRHIEHLRAKGMKAALSIGSWWSRTMELLYTNTDQNGAIILDKNKFLMDAGRAWDECYYCHHSSAEHIERILEGGEKHIECQHKDVEVLDIVSGTKISTSRECGCTKFLNMESLKLANPKGYDKFKGIEGAILMCSEYWDTFASADQCNWRILSAELGFGLKGEVSLGENDKVVVNYVGKPDLVIYMPNGDLVMPVDHKTNDRIPWDVNSKYKPHPQTAGYIYAVNALVSTLGITRKPVDRCIINVAARSRPADKPRDGKPRPRFTRVFPAYSAPELEEWRDSVLRKATRLRYSLENDEWLPRESQCHLFAGCDYLELSNKPAAVRDLVKRTDFVTIAPWVPYEVDSEEE